MSVTAKQLTGAKSAETLKSYVNILKAGEKLTGVNEANVSAIEKILKGFALKLQDVKSNGSFGKSKTDVSTLPKSTQELLTAHTALVKKINAELEKHFGAKKGVRHSGGYLKAVVQEAPAEVEEEA